MENPNPWPLAWGITATCLVTLAGGGLLVYNGVQPERVTAPTSYAQFVADDKAFKCQYPTGWKVTAATPQGTDSYAHFKKGTAKINIDADLQGSLQADIMRSSQSQMGDTETMGGGGGVPGASAMGIGVNDQRPPIERLHEAHKEAMAEENEEYSEQPPKVLTSPLGEGRISEYTYKDGAKMHGFRASILSGEKFVDIQCECLEKDWPMLKPAFTKVIASLQPG